MESVKEYTARLLSYVEGKDPVAVLTETPSRLSALIRGVPNEKLTKRPEPDKWSVLEIVAHLAEAEIALSWRYRQILETDGAQLPGYDQNLWSKVGNYPAWDIEDALNEFRLLRQANLNLFSRMSEEHWQRHGVHLERGRMTFRELAQQAAGHDSNHLQQVQRILRG